MREFFDMEGPFFRGLSTVADLMILNLIALVCSLPIVTAGASYAALHYVCLKIIRGEENYITKQYFSAFKQNFKQATLAWLLYLALIVLLITDCRIITGGVVKVPFPILIGIIIATFVLLMTALYVFPLLARFENTLGGTLRNAVLLTVGAFPRSLLMMVFMLVPVALIFVSPAIIPFLLMFGLSVPVLGCAWVYNPLFKKLEAQAGGAESAAESADAEDAGSADEEARESAKSAEEGADA